MDSKTDNTTKLVLFIVLLLAIFAFVYLFSSGTLKMGVSGSFTYLIYILLGLLSSVVCYGLLSSFGEIQGHKYETTIKLGGAIVGLVVVGGGGLVYEKYYHLPDSIDVRINFYTSDKNQLQKIKGQVSVFYGNTEKDVPVSNQSSILFQGIPSRLVKSQLNISVDCDDFVVDSSGNDPRAITEDQPIYIKLKHKMTFATAAEADLSVVFEDVSAVNYIKRPDAKNVIVRINIISNSDLLIPLKKIAHLQVLMNSGAPLVDINIESPDEIFIEPRAAKELFFDGFITNQVYPITKGRTAILTLKYKNIKGKNTTEAKTWPIEFDWNPKE